MMSPREFGPAGSTSSPKKGDDSPLPCLDLGIVRKHLPDTYLRQSEAQRDTRITIFNFEGYRLW